MTIFSRSAAQQYRDSIKRLEAAEKRHSVSLDELAGALEARRANDVPGLRIAAQKSEESLSAALEAAALSHRSYWASRRDALMPEVLAVAHLVRRFNRIARCAGVTHSSPFDTVLQDALAVGAPVDVIDAEGIPEEGPDSEVLDDFRGAWKYGSRLVR